MHLPPLTHTFLHLYSLSFICTHFPSFVLTSLHLYSLTFTLVPYMWAIMMFLAYMWATMTFWPIRQRCVFESIFSEKNNFWVLLMGIKFIIFPGNCWMSCHWAIRDLRPLLGLIHFRHFFHVNQHVCKVELDRSKLNFKEKSSQMVHPSPFTLTKNLVQSSLHIKIILYYCCNSCWFMQVLSKNRMKLIQARWQLCYS